MQSLMLLVHAAPSQPSGHRQVKPSPLLTHVAPFWHGDESQGRRSAAAQNKLMHTCPEVVINTLHLTPHTTNTVLPRILTDLTDAAAPLGQAVTHEAVAEVHAGAAILAGVGVAVGGGGGAGAALPLALADAGEVPVSVPAGGVVSARTLCTLVHICRRHKTRSAAP